MRKNQTLENYLKRLKELDTQIDGDSNENELLTELNKIITGISKEMNVDGVKSELTPELRFVNKSTNPDPAFAYEGDSGFDLRANLKEEITINEGRVKVIPTGLYFEVKKGLEIQVRSRSGLAANNTMWVLNSPGTVDSGYREEVKVILANFSDIPRTIRHGDRIAQGVVCPVYGEGNLTLIRVKELSLAVRNTRGLGSTGVSS